MSYAAHPLHALMIRRRARAAAAKAFTLIELIVVIAIIAILAAILVVGIPIVMGKSKKGQTKTALEHAGNALQTLTMTDMRAAALLDPSSALGGCNAAFKKAVGAEKKAPLKNLDTMQRAKLLAFLLACTEEQWSKIKDPEAEAKAGGRSLKPKVYIEESESKSILGKDSDGFDYVKDGWDNPLSYEVIQAVGAAANAAPMVVVISSGADSDMKAVEDNMNWTFSKNHFDGAYDQK